VRLPHPAHPAILCKVCQMVNLGMCWGNEGGEIPSLRLKLVESAP